MNKPQRLPVLLREKDKAARNGRLITALELVLYAKSGLGLRGRIGLFRYVEHLSAFGSARRRFPSLSRHFQSKSRHSLEFMDIRDL